MADLVDNKEDVVKNIRTFAGDKIAQTDRRRKMKNVMHFVGCKNNGRYSFAPSEFVGLKNNDRVEKKVLQNEKDRRYAALTKLLGEPLVYKKENPDNKKIYDAYQDCCVQMGTRPNVSTDPRYFWLIDFDVPRAHSIQPTTHPPQQATPKHYCKILKAYTLIQRFVRQLVRR